MEVLMTEFRRALAQRNHTRLDTHRLQLRGVELICAPRKLLEVNAWRECHFARVDLEDTCTRGFVR